MSKHAEQQQQQTTSLTQQELELVSQIKSHPIFIVKWGAEWCGPCKKMKPDFDKVVAKYGVAHVDLDVDLVKGSLDLFSDNYSLDKANDGDEKFSITSLPTIIVYMYNKQTGKLKSQKTQSLNGLLDILKKSK